MKNLSCFIVGVKKLDGRVLYKGNHKDSFHADVTKARLYSELRFARSSITQQISAEEFYGKANSGKFFIREYSLILQKEEEYG